MATIAYQRNQGSIAVPSWVSFGANTLVFSGSINDLTVAIATTDWQDGTHIGSNDPGTDQCGGGPAGSGHTNNVKYISSTQFALNGGATETLNDTNLTDNECSFRIWLNNGTAVATQNTFFFCYDGTTDTTEAVGIESYAFERGVAATTWTQINDDSANIGGDNATERLDLGEKTSATDHYWYLAISSRGESAGGKTSFDYKIRTQVFGLLIAVGTSILAAASRFLVSAMQFSV